MKIKAAVVVTAMGGAVVGLSAAPPAHAWPQPPPPGCEARFMVSYCDGPIQPDGSWQRCFENQQVWSPGLNTWIGGSNCYQVGPGPDPLPWTPQYHIGS